MTWKMAEIILPLRPEKVNRVAPQSQWEMFPGSLQIPESSDAEALL